MPSDQTFYLTTPIYYVNARPHIGHAYSTILADVIARRHRLLGDDTYFLTGTDEHGQKIERSAAAAGIPPQEFADQVSETFRSLWKRMGITNDDFIRTTEPRHKQGVQKLFATLQANGYIYLDTYTGQYCVSDEAYVEVGPGEPCPDCGRITETISESNYYFKLSAFQEQLIDLIAPGRDGLPPALEIKPDSRRNEILKFLSGNFAPILLNATTTLDVSAEREFSLQEGTDLAIEKGKLKYTPKGHLYMPGALKDLSVSRTSFKWGIPVPGDEAHVIYVWLDALANYMTAIGYGSEDPEEKAKFDKYWPAKLHLVGKEIIRFHSVYWPAFLMAASLPLPKSIVANGWLLFEESKMSKSRGNVVRTETILDAFGGLKPEINKVEQDLFATDVLRYFLLREIPFGQDGSFSFDAMVTRYNADLANGYGNLVSRTLALINQNCGGIVPEYRLSSDNPIDIRSDASELAVSAATEVIAFFAPTGTGYQFQISQEFDRYGFNELLFGIASSVAKVDSLLALLKPWVLAKKTDGAEPGSLPVTLYTAAESIRIITALLYPILPYATAQVWSQLGLGSIEEAAKSGALKDLKWGGLQPGTKLGPLSPIFPRAPKELIQQMADTEAANAAPPSLANQPILTDEANPTAAEDHASTHPAAAPRTGSLPSDNAGTHVAGSAALTTERPGTPSHIEAPASAPFASAAAASAIPDTPQIVIDDFVKIDLRVAQIVVAERIPKADKLLRLEVDLGYEKRQILSGIAEWYTPEDLIGRRIVVITNLAPRKMRGLESHGMLLAASEGDHGKPALATCGEDIALGSRLR